MRGRALLLVTLGIACLLFLAVSVSATPTMVGAEKCKMCHKVQYESWAASKHATKADPKVDCETCHGAGSDYKTMSVMKDPEKAKAAGLIAKPDKATCMEKCHKDNFKDEMITTVHAHKVKAP